MKWADGARKLKVRANADTPADARAAIKFGAEGIGLCRTEHMFFDEDRIRAVREMILAEDEKARRAALAKLLPMQRADFVELFKIMDGLPVTIRLLDPPLHEFLPHTDERDRRSGAGHGRRSEKARRPRARAARVQSDARLPRLPAGDRLSGNRRDAGARHLRSRGRGRPRTPARRSCRKSWCRSSPAKPNSISSRSASTPWPKRSPPRPRAQVKYQVGTMIELPRAALMAGEIAETAEFFSFGTNDLTQTTFGISRDDAASFLGIYTSKGILAGRSVRVDRPRGRRRTRPHRHRARPQGAARTSSSASAASMAAIPPRSRSATRSGSTTCPARRSACRSRASPPRRPRLAREDRDSPERDPGSSAAKRVTSRRRAAEDYAATPARKASTWPAQIGDGGFHRARGVEHDFGRHVGLRRGAGDVVEHRAPCSASPARRSRHWTRC